MERCRSSSLRRLAFSSSLLLSCSCRRPFSLCRPCNLGAERAETPSGWAPPTGVTDCWTEASSPSLTVPSLPFLWPAWGQGINSGYRVKRQNMSSRHPISSIPHPSSLVACFNAIPFPLFIFHYIHIILVGIFHHCCCRLASMQRIATRSLCVLQKVALRNI